MTEASIFPPALLDRAQRLVVASRDKGVSLTTAESCTGGLLAALLTEVAGSSTVFERGLVTYSNEAKADLLRVPDSVLMEYGAVSEQCARAMAAGAREAAGATVAVSVTGIAGPGGGSAAKPVGLVHFAAAGADGVVSHRGLRFGDLGRSGIRLAAVSEALDVLEEAVARSSSLKPD